MNKISDWLASIIETVPEFNVVYTYIREIRSIVQLARDFGTGKKDDDQAEITRGWMIKIKSYKPKIVTYDGATDCTYDIQIEGLSSLHSAGESARLFEEHAKAVVNIINAQIKDKRRDEPPLFEILQPAQITELSERIWPANGGRLHHHALLALSVRTKEKIGEL